MKGKRRCSRGWTTGLALLAAVSVQAQYFKADGIFYKMDDNPASRKVEVATGVGAQLSYKGTVVIPPIVFHDGQQFVVTGIGDGAFRACKKLEEVQLPISCTQIGKDAFTGSTVKVVKPIPTLLADLFPGYPEPSEPVRPDLLFVPTEQVLEQYGKYFVMKSGDIDMNLFNNIMKKDGTDNVSFTTCFDGLYGISPNTAALEAYINRTGMTVEAENVDIPIASDGNETMNLEFVEDATATNGFYGAISARHPSNHTSFTILLRDLLAEKHYNIYCKFFPTPSGLPSLFTSQARYGNGYNEYMLPHEDMMERIPEDVRKQANIQRAYATDGKQAETMCIAFDLQPKILGGTDLIISSFGPAATKLKEVVYTRTICFDYVEIHAFDTTEEAEADYAQWKSTQQ